jgi:Zn finger protein HypA/HybF involved in hydrogenase expression
MIKDEFIKQCNIIFNNKYDYTDVNYINNKTPIKIKCPIHGEFNKTPNNHKNHKQGCPKCVGDKLSLKFRKEINVLIKQFNKIHNNKYDYSFVNYINDRTKIKIKCPEHGIFEQIPSNHIKGVGCPICNGGVKLTLEDFINKSNKIHNNHYNYSLVEYENNKSKIKIICPNHGVFIKDARHHLSGGGCNICKLSKGELKIKKFLDDRNIKYIQQYKFIDCRNQKPLPFDFYLPEYNMCIEYNGEQHYKPLNNFGGEKSFNKLKKRDGIKNSYCISNNIKLLIIKYDENLENVLLGYGGFNTMQIKKDVKDNLTPDEETQGKDLLKD